MSDVESEGDVPIFEGGEGDVSIFIGGEREVPIFGNEQMDATLDSFSPEPSIHHDVYPESDDEGEFLVRNSALQPIGNAKGMYVGQIFHDKKSFGDCVLHHALKDGRNIKQYRYDKTKIGYRCVGGNCEWRVYCGKVANRDEWELRVYKDKHSCVPNGECELMKVPVIAGLFLDKLREDPEDFMPMKMEELIMATWKIKVTRGQCQVARINALRWIEREHDIQFERLRDYAAEIRESNPNTVVEVETIRNEDGLDVFNRFYVCFEALRKSWKETCRPVIGVDGCFLKGKMKGQLLVAIGRDADNSIYPIAWGVVQVENTSNWLWFVRKLKADLMLEDGEGYVLVSDRQKGLIRAVELEMPNIEHRMCVRHIYANLKVKHGKKPEMKPLVWRLSWSYSEAEYNANLDRIMVYDIGVYEDIIESNPKTWCRAFYKIGSHCEDVDNNFTESFNATIVKARGKPLVPMLELIARLAMVRICKRSIMAIEHQGRCTPYVQSILEKEYPVIADCRVFRSTNHMYQVLFGGCSYQVSLETRTCSCRKWDIRGIPCEHGYAAILHRKFKVEDFVSHWFRTTIWRRTYTDGLTPNRGSAFWPVGTGPPVHMPSSPPQPGRKKIKKRKKGINESPTKKAPIRKRVMHCKVCGAPNHNARFHSKKGGNQGESSQVVPSQAASQGQASQVSQNSEASQRPATQPEASQRPASRRPGIIAQVFGSYGRSSQ